MCDQRMGVVLGLMLAVGGAAALVIGDQPTKPEQRAAEGEGAGVFAENRASDAKGKKQRFLRVARSSKGEPIALETSVARYVPKGADREGLVVELVSAVHVGDGAYFSKLNKLFENYDVLLYELVAPEGTRVPKGGGDSKSVVSGVQNAMKDVLGLEFQLREVDYSKDNFIHADMSPDDFSKAMSDRGESIWGMMFRMMGQSMAQQAGNPNGLNDVDLLMALFDSNRSLKLKRLMATQFENLEFVTSALSGPQGSTLIEGRNQACLKVLSKQIEGGKKKIGIFYGAGHMPDMEKRLLADFGLRLEEERWVEAWNMRDPAGEKGAKRNIRPAEKQRAEKQPATK